MLKEYKDAEAEILIDAEPYVLKMKNTRIDLKVLKKAIKIYAELEDMGQQGLLYDLIGRS